MPDLDIKLQILMCLICLPLIKLNKAYLYLFMGLIGILLQVICPFGSFYLKASIVSSNVLSMCISMSWFLFLMVSI